MFIENLDQLAELMVRRKYKDKDLPDKFWNLPQYRGDYAHQMRFAVKLARAYELVDIISAVHSQKWCYSLGWNGWPAKIKMAKFKRVMKSKTSKPKKINNTLKKSDEGGLLDE